MNARRATFARDKVPSRSRYPEGSDFPDDLMRRFVGAQSLKCRVPQQAIIRPLGKTDLGDELRFQPAKFLHLLRGYAFAEMTFATARQIIEGTFAGEQRPHCFKQAAPGDRIESLPNF